MTELISSTDVIEPPRTIFHSRQNIEAGDLVILFQTRENLLAIIVTPGEHHHSKWGKYAHSDMVGMRFGSRMASPAPHAGYIHLLRPSPSLWSLSLPHRTQIVYLPDISFIMNELRIKMGSRVIEAGTGSGSMSHSLALAVGINTSKEGKGKLFSFEYHATRFEKAKKEFISHGLEHVVQLQHRNVCKDGFGDGPSNVDSVFLDLPAPWEAIPHALKHLRSDISTRICCFSPCIEQVTRTVQALDANGFTHIEMYEVLVRPHEIVQPIPTVLSVGDVAKRLKKQEIRREERRLLQMDAARKRNARMREDKERQEAGLEPLVREYEARSTPRDSSNGERGEKRRREETELDEEAGEEEWNLAPLGPITRVVQEVRGHTSYLTFATMFPAVTREAIEQREEEKRRRLMVRTAELAGVPSEGGMAKAVALRAMAGAGAATTGVISGLGSLPGSSERSMTRETSFDTQISDGFERALASMTEEELMGIAPPKP